MKTFTRDQLDLILKDHGEWLRSERKKGRKADLADADLSGVNLSQANLMMADLSGADLSGANLLLIDLSQADLTGADLSGADLSGADLLLAIFANANLSGADLSVADLSGANLAHSRLLAASLPQADLSGTDFTGADFSNADLSGANLSGADLTRTNLSQARLLKANLSGADLSGAELLLVSLEGVNLNRTNLTGAVIDSLTLTQLPDNVERKFRESIRIVEMERTDQFAVIRDIRLPGIFYLPGISILDFFCMYLAGYSAGGDIKVKMEYRNNTVRIVVETPNDVIRNQMEELFEIFGFVVQKKLDFKALSGKTDLIHRFENQIRQAARLLEAEKERMTDSGGNGEPHDLTLDALLDHVGRLLQHPESRPRPREIRRTP